MVQHIRAPIMTVVLSDFSLIFNLFGLVHLMLQSVHTDYWFLYSQYSHLACTTYQLRITSFPFSAFFAVNSTLCDMILLSFWVVDTQSNVHPFCGRWFTLQGVQLRPCRWPYLFAPEMGIWCMLHHQKLPWVLELGLRIFHSFLPLSWFKGIHISLLPVPWPSSYR